MSLSRHGGFTLVSLAAVGLLGVAYSNHFQNAFHFDDRHVIVDNLAIRSLHDWPRFFTDATTFTSRPENASYRPLLTLSYALDYRLGGGLNPRAFHGTQFALLLGLGVGLVALYRRLADQGWPSRANRWLALGAATGFCVHTANTETVNYLSSRSSLVASLGLVTAFLVWDRWPRARSTGLYLLPVVVGGLAKPLTVMFAPLLTLWVLLFDERLSIPGALHRSGWSGALRAVLRTLPAHVVCAGLFVGLRAMEPDSLQYAIVGRWTYAMTQPFVWLHYMRLFFWPVGLTADTDWRLLETWQDWRLAAGGMFVTALLAAAVLLSRSRRLAPAAFGLIWFGLVLLPTSSIFPLSEVYNEHRIFLPYVGLAFAVCWCAWVAARRIAHRSPSLARPITVAAAVAACAILLAHAAGTHHRNRVWRSDLSLWSDVARKSPRNGRGLMNYGLALMARGQLEAALEQFELAHALAPNYPILEINLGIVKAALGRHDEAGAHFARALWLDPDYGQGRVFYANWLLDRARGPEAIAQLELAVENAPWGIEPRKLLLRLYAATGRAGEMRALAEDTLRIDPAQPIAIALSQNRPPFLPADSDAAQLVRIGRARIDQKQWIDGAVLNRFAIARNGADASAWNNLGWALAKLGFWSEAIASFRRATALDPELATARNNLAWAESEARAGGRSTGH